MLPAALLQHVEDAGLNASAPPQQRWVDGWLVRLCPGKARRARCINAVAAGRQPIAAKLARCEAAYGQAGLPLLFRITPFSLPAGLETHLDYLGLQPFDETRVMVRQHLAELEAPDLPPGIMLRDLPIEAFTQRVGAWRGSPLAHRQSHAERLRNAPVPFHAFELLAGGEPVACGQFALEDDLVGLYDIFTHAAARGRGHARLLCALLLARARALGAAHGYLQVDAANAAALAVYRRLGFVDGYGYHYRARDPAAT
jgi:ribosomal protein S18 acetylase RimI-like enzyme